MRIVQGRLEALDTLLDDLRILGAQRILPVVGVHDRGNLDPSSLGGFRILPHFVRAVQGDRFDAVKSGPLRHLELLEDGHSLWQNADAGAFLDGRGDFLRLADPEADDPVAVANDHQRAEAQVLAALDHLGHAVDRHHVVLDVELRRIDSLASSHTAPRIPVPLCARRPPRRGCVRDTGSRCGRTRRA